jgi:hypothetical protein
MEKASYYLGLIAAHGGKEEAHKGRKKMTTDGHDKGSGVSHKNLNDETFEREIVEMEVQVSVLMEQLQESDEDHICGWNVRKKVKCYIDKFFVRKLRQSLQIILTTWMEKEKLR